MLLGLLCATDNQRLQRHQRNHPQRPNQLQAKPLHLLPLAPLLNLIKQHEDCVGAGDT